MKEVLWGRRLACGGRPSRLVWPNTHPDNTGQADEASAAGEAPAPQTQARLPVVSLAIALLLAIPLAAQDANDVLLRAMRDEMARAPQLNLVAGSDPLYFLEYSLDDATAYSVSAVLGGLVSENHARLRLFRPRARVGSYDFDNTDYVGTDAYSGTRFDSETLPLDNSYPAIRQQIWLATDRAFKQAIEAIGRKRSAIENVNQQEKLPDFSKAPPVRIVRPPADLPFDEAAWRNRTVALSALFAAYPQVLGSSVDFEFVNSTAWLLNNEGTESRRPDHVAFVRVRGWGQAPDGMIVRDADVEQAFEPARLPSALDLLRTVETVAKNITALAAAPKGEAYTGPVVFEPHAAAQLFAELLGSNLRLTRKPVGEPGQPSPWAPSELETRLGSRVLPEWMDVVDDPSQTEFHGEPLFGHYDLDDEGVVPHPLSLIEKGVLKNFLLTRTPVRAGFTASNGRARMPGPYGTKSADFGTLFVRASQTEPLADLKKKLIDMCRERQKPYGILVRTLDYPTSAPRDELRKFIMAMARSGAGSRPVPLPVLIYRVYPDGREELIRGMRFRGVSTRSFRDITAASSETYVFNFLDSPAPFAMMGAAGIVVNTTVVSPALLFDELELETNDDDTPRIPLVPPPPIEQRPSTAALH